MSKQQSLFETLYGATDELLKGMKKPLVEKRLKRKLSSAFDDAEDRKLNAQAKLEDERKKFEYYDVNTILSYKQTIDTCNDLQAKIKAEYLEYFGVELS